MKVICTRNNAEFEFVRMEGEDYVLADKQARELTLAQF